MRTLDLKEMFARAKRVSDKYGVPIEELDEAYEILKIVAEGEKE